MLEEVLLQVNCAGTSRPCTARHAFGSGLHDILSDVESQNLWQHVIVREVGDAGHDRLQVTLPQHVFYRSPHFGVWVGG